jgi:hypothetical protein
MVVSLGKILFFNMVKPVNKAKKLPEKILLKTFNFF